VPTPVHAETIFIMDDDLPDILWQRIQEAERVAPAERPTVLVVEDDPSARLLMRYALRSVVRTDAASTVTDALRMAEGTPYDGLLVDIYLPDGKGTEIVERLRNRTPYWGVPMVAVTAHTLPDDCDHFLDAGFDAYLAKPFKQDELRTLLRHLVVEGEEEGQAQRLAGLPEKPGAAGTPRREEPTAPERPDAAEQDDEAPSTLRIEPPQHPQ